MAPRRRETVAMPSPKWQECDGRGPTSWKTSTAGLGEASIALRTSHQGRGSCGASSVWLSQVAVTA